MRIRIAGVITLFVVLFNILALYYIRKIVIGLNQEDNKPGHRKESKPRVSDQKPLASQLKGVKFIEKSITVIIRRFEFFERDVAETILSFLSLYPNLRILVVSDVLPYPPLQSEAIVNYTNNVQIINMQLDLTSSYEKRSPLFYVETKYVLFVPDATRIVSKNLLGTMLSKLSQQSPHFVAVPVSTPASVGLQCLKVHVEIREWFVAYETLVGDVCDSIHGKHVILVEKETLMKLPEPFMLPFPNALYIQTAAQHLKVKLIADMSFIEGRQLFQSKHAQWKVDQLHKTREEQMFRHFDLKKVVRESGAVEMYGCTRDRQRCFGTVVNDMPDYLWQGKWTPPCCLNGLRHTARHVFKNLESAGVRYWLEGGSLLGAMRSSDILPWDYDVDLGIYQEDIHRSKWLVQAQKGRVIDKDGFVWEKARPTEGEFFRVQFSISNHLHVDLFPFYSRNGTMTKKTWFASHKQDCEFPEHFLQPMTTVDFVGHLVSAPNNIPDFLELKFGKGVIANPQYPDPKKLKFPLKDIPKNFDVGIVAKDTGYDGAY